MSEITIITVNWHSTPLIRTMLANLQDRASAPEKLRALIVDNTNGADKGLGDLTNLPMEVTVDPLDTEGLTGGLAHGAGMNRAMELVETPYGVIVDPDIHVFRRGWDELCVARLKRNGAAAIGAPYPEWKVGKYHDFPSPPFCLFDTAVLRNMESDWSAMSRYGKPGDWLIFAVRQFGRLGGLVTRRRYEQSGVARAYSALSERVFGVFTQDAGWRLAEEAREKNIPTILFDAVMPTHVYLAPPSARDAFLGLAAEYELFYYEQRPMLTHKYSSGGRPWRTKRGDDEAYWRKCIADLEAFDTDF